MCYVVKVYTVCLQRYLTRRSCCDNFIMVVMCCYLHLRDYSLCTFWMNNKRWWYFPQFRSFTAVCKIQHNSAHSYAPTIKAEHEFCRFATLLRALVQSVLVLPFRLFIRHKLSAEMKCKWAWWRRRRRWWWWW